jgi:uncharacterized protein (DUF427 family)
MATRFSDALPRDLRYEPTPKRVRVTCGETAVADTTLAVLVWEPGRVVPLYAVPEADMDAGVLESEADLLADRHSAPLTQAFSVEAGGSSRGHAAWRYEDPDLAGYLALHWPSFDAWFEEDELVVGHPRDPFHRVDIRRSSRHVRIELDGTVLADSRRPTLVFETGHPVRHYLPRDDVRMDLLAHSEHTTICAYKGVASYFSVRGAGDAGRNLLWSYEQPLSDSAALRELVCFFGERLDVTVDGRLITRPITQWS